jgi:hypothetical protein
MKKNREAIAKVNAYAPDSSANVENKPKSCFVKSHLCQDVQFAQGSPAAQPNFELNKDRSKVVVTFGGLTSV